MTVDRIDFNDISEMETKFDSTPEGYLLGRAILTNVGVFTYMNADGTSHRELRCPEEVFAKDSLDTLLGKPLTNEHPSEAVSVENAEKYQAGTVLGPVTHDAYHVASGLSIMKADAIEDAKNGKRGLSCGYSCTLDPTPGVWMGVKYDSVQRNIRYNHVAMCEKGRAGDAARLRMDSVAPYGIQVLKEDTTVADKVMRQIVLDSVSYDAEEKVAEAYQKALAEVASEKQKLDSVSAEKSAVEAERDALKARVDSLDKELVDLKAKHVDASEIDARVKARLSLVASATKVGVEVQDAMDDKAVMVATIQKLSPTAKLDDAADVYIKARFDAELAIHAERQDSEADATARASTQERGDACGTSAVDKEKAFQERIYAAGKKKKEGK